MNYIQSIDYIHSIPRFVRPLGNEKLGALLNALGNPHKSLKYIHIAGTNGKGSTAAMTASILQAQCYKVGMFTSPYIEVFNERIQINSVNIPDEELALYVTRVKDVMEQTNNNVSEFAFITATAFLYFYEKQCDFVILEAGMGGRLDATNIIEKPLVSVLTSISLDHMQYLGNTIEEIAYEKCGIIKENGVVVTYPNDEVLNIIENSAKKKSARLIIAKKSDKTDNGFIYNKKEYPLSLKGEYQPQNAAVVLETVNELKNQGIAISDDAVAKGFLNVRWPARFEYVASNIILDGGHNIDGIRVLKKSLEALKKPVILVMAMMKDKSFTECIKEISVCAKYLIATELNMERCAKAKEILSYSKLGGETAKNPEEALKRAVQISNDDDLICVCGSMYLVGEIRKLIKQ